LKFNGALLYDTHPPDSILTISINQCINIVYALAITVAAGPPQKEEMNNVTT